MTSVGRSTAARAAVLWTATVLVAACGSTVDEGAAPTPTAVLSVPAQAGDGDVERPIQDTQLDAGTRYRYDDVLPGTAVDLTGPEPTLYSYATPGLIALSPDADFRTDSLYVTDLDVALVPDDPFQSLADIASDQDVRRLSRGAPADFLAYATALPFVDLVIDERPLTVGAVEGRAVDVRIRELPAEAVRCGRGSGVGLPACAVLLLPPGSAPLAQSGQTLRLIEVELPAGRLLVYQNVDRPEGQAVLDSLTFVHPASTPEAVD